MLITHEKMREINDIQVEILRDVVEVCDKLDIKFYMVHGSLLGTIRDHKFVPDDDDIDIAFFRDDYEKFLKEAPKFLKEHYFVQSNKSDAEYPLEFAKVRDSRTTYIIEIAEHLNINHGIYIDVFPIDNFTPGVSNSKINKIKYRLLRGRVACAWKMKNRSKAKKAFDLVCKIAYPSLNGAIKKLEKFLTSQPVGEYVRVSGGKSKEIGIPRKWFETAVEDNFEGVKAYIPCDYDAYLTRIYGDYKNRTLVEKKISDDTNIEINANLVDTKKPFTDYIKR